MININIELLNLYNVDAANIIGSAPRDLPEYGDDVKILEKKVKTQVLDDFVFIFNFTKGNVIKITRITGRLGVIMDNVVRIQKPDDLLQFYQCVLGNFKEN